VHQAVFLETEGDAGWGRGAYLAQEEVDLDGGDWDGFLGGGKRELDHVLVLLSLLLEVGDVVQVLVGPLLDDALDDFLATLFEAHKV
jgi:hypothetical protein